MIRTALALLFVLAASPAFAQQPAVDVPFSEVGIGLITSATPIEADGKPGAEWLVTRFSWGGASTWVLYPSAPRSGDNGANEATGLCMAGPFAVERGDSITDIDGDGKAERVRFDFVQQRVKVWPLPTGECFKN